MVKFILYAKIGVKPQGKIFSLLTYSSSIFIIPNTMTNSNTFLNKNVEKRCYLSFVSWLPHRSTHKLQSLTAQISVKLFWIIIIIHGGVQHFVTFGAGIPRHAVLCLCNNMSAVLSKNTVSANMKYSTYFHQTSNFRSIHYEGCMYIWLIW